MGDRRLAVWPSTRTTCILRWALSSRSDIDLAFRIVLFVMQFGSRKDLQTWCYNLETFGFFTVDESLAVVGDRGNGEEGNKRKVIGKISKNGKRKIKIQQKIWTQHFKKRVSIRFWPAWHRGRGGRQGRTQFLGCGWRNVWWAEIWKERERTTEGF